jgi:hypothetical protein
MEAMAREAWTDERLDDLEDQMVTGFLTLAGLQIF